MRVLKSFLLLALGLWATACSSDVDGAAPSGTAPAAAEASPTDKLALRAIQLLDSATQVVSEATEHGKVEPAAATLKSLGVELGQIRDELNAGKITLETHAPTAQRWAEAKLRLRNAISLMTTNNPEAAKTLTGVLSGLSLND